MSDISSIGAMSMNSYVNQAKSSASTSAMEDTLSKDYANATDDELMAVCKDFESYFVEQLIKAMESTLDEEEDPLSGEYSYFKDMQTQQYAEMLTEQTDLGLAQMLYEQMKRNYGA